MCRAGKLAVWLVVVLWRRSQRHRLREQVSRAGDLADWLVRKSQMHPTMRNNPVMLDIEMGGYDDPTTRNMAPRFEHLTLQLQRAAYQRATRLVRRDAIHFSVHAFVMQGLHPIVQVTTSRVCMK